MEEVRKTEKTVGGWRRLMDAPRYVMFLSDKLKREAD